MDTDKSIFGWLHSEIQGVRTRGFYIVAPDGYVDLEIENLSVFSKSQYAQFLKEFGWVQLYRYPADGSNGCLVSVYPLRAVRVHLVHGRKMVEFGFRSNISAFFDLEMVSQAGFSYVYSVRAGRVLKEFDSFGDWLYSACKWARNKFSDGRWERIVNGPRPFSKRELTVVEARKKYTWKNVGFASDGDAIFEVRNDSDLILPYYSIGVQGVWGVKLIGGAWLNVSNIESKKIGIVKQNCYKEMLAQDEVEFYDLLPPIPETKNRYWEFKLLKA